MSAAPVMTISRRGLMGGAAGLSFAFAMGGRFGTVAEAAATEAKFSPNVWLIIGADNTVTIMSPAAEMGQGSYTSLPVIIAEELDADWSRVKIEQSPMDAKNFGNPAFGGMLSYNSSETVSGYYPKLRLVGAGARRVLIDAAAAKWNVPADELTTEPSMMVHAKSGQRMSYGAIAAFAEVPAQAPVIDPKDLKPMNRFRLIGSDIHRDEIPLKVRGAAVYSMDVHVPGMLYAAVLQSPYEGGAPMTVDDAKARAMAGVIDVVKLPGGVGVLGDSFETTQAAKNSLAVTWTDAPGATMDSEKVLEEFGAVARDMGQRGVDYFNSGNVETAMPVVSKKMTGEYRTRHVYHAQMEPLNATASAGSDGKSAEIWMGTQGPSLIMTTAAQVLGTTPDKIMLHQQWLGGAYGRRGTPDIALDALRLSLHAAKPVKVVWSRTDDIKAGKFRPATAHHIEAGFDQTGKIIAWHHRIIAESVLASLVGATAFARMGGQDQILMKGSVLEHYGIPNRRSEFVRQTKGARVLSLRGVGVSHNLFANEGFIDEIAHAQGKDPLAFRLGMTRAASPRATKLLETVAQMADWGKKRNGRALGLALEEKDKTLVAGIAEISLDRVTNQIKVHNFWAAIDCGVAVQPRNIAALTEGGIVFGLGHALREEITIKDGRVQQTNFPNYQVMRMEDVPEIKVTVISTDNPPTGAGEDGVPLAAACVGNAFFALTGVRMREIPMTPDRIKTALAATGKA